MSDYNINQPEHKIANQVLNRLESYLFDNDVKVKFGSEGRAIVEELIDAYNKSLSKMNDEKYAEETRLLGIISEIRQLTRLTKDETDIGTAVRRLCLIWDKCDEADGKS